MAKRRRGENARPYPKKQFSKPSPSVPIPPAERVLPDLAQPLALLSKKEVLKILSVSHVTLRDMIRKGVIPPPRVYGGDTGCSSTIRWLSTEFFAALANAPRRLPGSEQGGQGDE